MNPKLLVIVGETASGKSDLALRMAEQFNGEIICADSWTVRKGVDIGTAKPPNKDRERVRHHLLDMVEPCGDFTAAVFKERAIEAIDDIARRGKLPIMAGGTGLYIDSILYDFNFLPAGDRKSRKALEEQTIPQLLALVRDRDIEPGDIDTRNKRRLIRLIETGGERPTRQALRPNTYIVGLKIPRETLKKRIIARADAMVTAGLEDEVRDLAKQYGWGCEALKGIGYAQWREYFEGSQTLYETRQKIIKATLDLAKRQRTWFKRNKSIHWVSTPVKDTNIIDEMTTFLNT